MLQLKPYGGSPALAKRIIERYGDRASRIIQTSPYRLALEVRGVGFQTADRIARATGISRDHPDRVQAGVIHVLGELSDQGHVYCPRQDLASRTAAMLGVDLAHVEAAIAAAWAGGRVVIEDDKVFPARLAVAEASLAAALERLLKSPGHVLKNVERSIAEFEAKAGVELSLGQRTAVEATARHKAIVITGGPGVGKTTIVLAILDVFKRARLTVRLAAPTGRAAKRLSEATREEATTLHRLLEYEPSAPRVMGQSFQRNVERPIEAQAVIVDEASMIDLQLADALLDAMPSAGRLVIVGDADQLPSVGPGAFLRDLIASGVIPVVRLEHIFRQAGQSNIVQNAHRILHGEEPVGARPEEPFADFFVVSRNDPDQAQATILELVTKRIPQRFGLAARDQIQVLCPMHRGSAGTGALNLALQRALNPHPISITRGNTTFRVGDKVLQTKNDYDKDVYNGDLGVIERIDPEDGSLVVGFDDRIVSYEGTELDTLILAYAISIHKSQGSEYPAVVIPLLTSHFVMLSRNLLYTAVTRARKLCVLVADPKAIALALAETRREDRRTLLAERLRRVLPGI
jgi:exodeoxyribonuclease V alpha subunit